MEDDESLVVVAPHGAVPVDTDGAPGDGGAGDEEVGGDVKSVADAGGHKGVEAVKNGDDAALLGKRRDRNRDSI